MKLGGPRASWEFLKENQKNMASLFMVEPPPSWRPFPALPAPGTPNHPSRSTCEVLIDSFSFRTALSDEQLDPVEWRLEASNDQSTWKVLHSQERNESSEGRKVPTWEGMAVDRTQYWNLGPWILGKPLQFIRRDGQIELLVVAGNCHGMWPCPSSSFKCCWTTTCEKQVDRSGLFFQHQCGPS